MCLISWSYTGLGLRFRNRHQRLLNWNEGPTCSPTPGMRSSKSCWTAGATNRDKVSWEDTSQQPQWLFGGKMQWAVKTCQGNKHSSDLTIRDFFFLRRQFKLVWVNCSFKAIACVRKIAFAQIPQKRECLTVDMCCQYSLLKEYFKRIIQFFHPSIPAIPLYLLLSCHRYVVVVVGRSTTLTANRTILSAESMLPRTESGLFSLPRLHIKTLLIN